MFTLKQVPFDMIKDGDFALTESVAMMRYLARTREVADHWYPKGMIIFDNFFITFKDDFVSLNIKT